MRLLARIFVWMGLLGACYGDGPVVIDDRALMSSIGEKVGGYVEAEKAVGSKVLDEQLKRAKTDLKLPEAGASVLNDVYEETVDGVGIITSVYKCGRCDEWHRSGMATCWVMTSDGVMVTNYHVFDGRDHAGFGVMMRDGKTYPVTEILAADKAADVAIFRVEATGLKALPLGKPQVVGGEAHIIAHPDGRFFSYTAGNVSRYYQAPRRDTFWMSVTAEFARGSSGGPVMDENGNVVGMVANTQSIYYPKKKKTDFRGPFQMVIRNCVPVAKIRGLIGAN